MCPVDPRVGGNGVFCRSSYGDEDDSTRVVGCVFTSHLFHSGRRAFFMNEDCLQTLSSANKLLNAEHDAAVVRERAG
ncbi:hypothetical protein HETIRDRAFT_309281 [Heterobasidion irregulare TC 32-1]|uniref:Uncharacterized protein n=1 Tax=Heterobasidion irregulare (strain TC 32-1) TaxID=747525 RepID=W4KI30_HETIT|nr:uncharacterized protein HETIRDRAFT_309281 [Heterobasidion irregulare TC 32-1]ETW85518.1 hypothetical protein HETIRDRAFT_309281 [Heterobasidion irregulare TC 32-1]